MLTFDEIRDLVATYRYHDGWAFEPFVDRWEGIALRIRTVQPDSNGGAPLELVIETFIPPLADAEALDHWLVWRLCRIAAHEAREFLTRRGVRVADPHLVEFDVRSPVDDDRVPCPAPGCARRIMSDLYACGAHWFALPEVIRAQVVDAIRARDLDASYAARAEAVAWWTT